MQFATSLFYKLVLPKKYSQVISSTPSTVSSEGENRIRAIEQEVHELKLCIFTEGIRVSYNLHENNKQSPNIKKVVMQKLSTLYKFMKFTYIRWKAVHEFSHNLHQT